MKTTDAVRHVTELRQRLIYSLIFFGVTLLCLMPFMTPLFDLLAQPIIQQMAPEQSLIAIGLPSTIIVPLKLVLYLALLISIPFILFQLWRFVAPALYQNEKRLMCLLITLSSTLFYLGIFIAYAVVLPTISQVLIAFTPDSVTLTPDIQLYLNFALRLFLAFGLAFEVPIIIIFLVLTQVVTVEQLKSARPYAIVCAFIFGMLLTPPDIISQIMLALPTWLLFEAGIGLAQLLQKRLMQTVTDE